jgi:hypothetical protein
MRAIVLSFEGQPPRKSNSRRLVRNKKTGRQLVIKSRKALQWMEDAGWQIPADAKRKVGGPDQPLRIVFYVRYRTRLADLSTELIMDTLQKYGVIRGDRYVFEKAEQKIIDKEDPGVDLVITETRERNLTREQCKVLAYEFAKVPHTLTELQGPFEDGSVLTHWSDGEWYVILADGETTGYEYDNEGQRDPETRIVQPGERNPQAKVTREDVLQIRRLHDEGELTMAQVGKMFGITESTASKIGLRYTWKHVPEEEGG